MSNTRREFASKMFNTLVLSYNLADNPSGYKARKIDQAYRIYKYYLNVNQVHPSIYNRVEIWKSLRNKKERKLNALKSK